MAESGNPGNEKRLTRLLLVYPSMMLPADVTFVDTPGLGSVTPGGALQTYAYLPRCDHATFLFEATAPVSEEDLTVLAFLHDAGITTSVLLSKADLLDSADLDRVRTYVGGQIRKKLGTDVAVRPMSTVPSHESLLRDWIRDEVTPLGGQAQCRAREAPAYYNHDHGQGPIRGIYLEGNEAVRPIFRAWFGPFADQGPFYLSNVVTGGTDNDDFVNAGIPGFQFVQQYDRTIWTHHSNVDLYDHLNETDHKRNVAIMAYFAYQTANRDELLPRSPKPHR